MRSGLSNTCAAFCLSLAIQNNREEIVRPGWVLFATGQRSGDGHAQTAFRRERRALKLRKLIIRSMAPPEK
jgi:hypothetical protein